MSSLTVPDAVLHRASAHRHDVAVVEDGRATTYAELVAKAGSVGDALRRVKVEPGSAVAVVERRGGAPLIAMLGCWFAGYTPVLIDANQPQSRIQYILDDAKAAAVVGEQFEDPDRPVIRQTEVRQVGLNFVVPMAVQAYTIYTSGSTGPPKGVLVGHRSLRALADWHSREYQVDRATHASSVASPGFDAYLWETLPYLCEGAAVHFAPDAVRLSPFELTDWYAEESVDISFLPTPLAEAYLQYTPSPRQLRCLLTGGDRLRMSGPHDLRRFVNHYGPTEATVVTTFADVPADSPAGPAPIGRPIPSARVLVVDPATGQRLDGEIGELLVGGDCLSLGYPADAELTRRRFGPVPGDPGLWYHTGDMVRRDETGCLWFVGRADRQVKVRGVRIEPAEIESALLAHSAVADVAVEQDARGELTAFLSAHFDWAESRLVATCREHLGQILPDSMIPRYYVMMERLPTTRNGKIDRSALRATFAARTPHHAN